MRLSAEAAILRMPRRDALKNSNFNKKRIYVRNAHNMFWERSIVSLHTNWMVLPVTFYAAKFLTVLFEHFCTAWIIVSSLSPSWSFMLTWSLSVSSSLLFSPRSSSTHSPLPNKTSCWLLGFITTPPCEIDLGIQSSINHHQSSIFLLFIQLRPCQKSVHVAKYAWKMLIGADVRIQIDFQIPIFSSSNFRTWDPVSDTVQVYFAWRRCAGKRR